MFYKRKLTNNSRPMFKCFKSMLLNKSLHILVHPAHLSLDNIKILKDDLLRQ